MQTATLYTLHSETVPLLSRDEITVYSPAELRPLYIEGETPEHFTVNTTTFPVHSVFKRLESARGFSDFHTPGEPWQFHESDEYGKTYQHLFAIDPALEEILSAPIRSKMECKVKKLEKECLDYNNANYEIEEKLKAAEQTISHLKRRIADKDATISELNKVRNRVGNFSQKPVWERLWIAFRNDLVP